MKTQTLGYKAQTLKKLVRSTEATITIKKGAPVVLSLAAGTLGFGVKSVEGLAVAEEGFFFGCAVADIAPGATGETVFGYFDYVRVIRASRSESGVVWVSMVAGSLGAVLNIVSASSLQAFSQSAAGSAITNPKRVILAETWASTTTQASSITAGVADSNLLYSTAYAKAFISIC